MKNKNNFIMDTDWLFDGILDAEQKQYVLLDYFQKMNKHLERMEVYPMFIELSLHLGNIQTLLTQNKILYVDKKLTSNDDELVLSDLKVKDIPVLDDEEVIEESTITANSVEDKPAEKPKKQGDDQRGETAKTAKSAQVY
jgi:hypothetical protein